MAIASWLCGNWSGPSVQMHIKGGIEGAAGPANAVPLSEAVFIAGPLFDQSHTHLMELPAHAQ